MQAVLVAEVMLLSRHGLPDRRPFGNVGLTARILNQLLGFSTPIYPLSAGRDAFDEDAEQRIQNNRGDNK